MSLKAWVTLGLIVGSIIGGYIPALWGDNSLFSVTSILFSTAGGLTGIWAGYRAFQYFS